MTSAILQLWYKTIQAAIWNKPFKQPLSKQDIERLLTIAKYQGIHEIILNTLFKNQADSDIKEFIPQLFCIENLKNKNAYKNSELCHFASLMERNNVDVRIIKGQLLACTYPEPLLRYSSDIDYYCDSKNYPLALKLMQKRIKGEIEDIKSRKHCHYTFHNIIYEQHSLLIEFVCPQHCRTLKEAIDEDLQHTFHFQLNGHNIPTFSPTLNAAHIFIHLFFHLISTGAHSRMFIDWALHLHAHRNDIDKNRLEHILHGCNMLRAYTFYGHILTECIGLPTEEFPFLLSDKDKPKALKEYQRILNPPTRHFKEEGFWHSIETTIFTINNGFHNIFLAPSEILLRVPFLIYWSLIQRPYKALFKRNKS